MNCYYHPEIAAVAFCRTCGRPLCASCQRPAEGTVFCQEHIPVTAYPAGGAAPAGPNVANPYFSPVAVPLKPPVSNSPVLAFLLGWIPGVGAIYNGQYLKGLLHALVFGFMVALVDSTPGPAQPLVGILLAAFLFYMPFEAYHTAKKRQLGIEPEEWSSILPRGTYAGRTPIGPIVLIAIGVLYLLNTLDLIEFRQIGRFWPVILIIVGAYMLYSRVSGQQSAPPAPDRFNGPTYPGPQAGPGSPTIPGNLMESRNE